MPSSVLIEREPVGAGGLDGRSRWPTMSVTLGLSFTISGRLVAARHAAVTAAAEAQSVPNAIPPASTLGHEMLTS